MRFRYLAVLIMILALSSCAKQESVTTGKTFTNPQYGFSFSYSGDFEETTQDLPDLWAIKDQKGNAILFVVSTAELDNIADIGRSQALSDLYPNAPASDIDERELKEVYDIVKVQQFNNRDFFTYGLKAPKDKRETLLSGTLCNGKEVLFVLSTDYESIETTRLVYLEILNSFSC